MPASPYITISLSAGNIIRQSTYLSASDIWVSPTRTLTGPVSVSGNVTIDPNTRVVLSASQPDYAPALQTTLLAGIANISGTQVIIISKEDSISATQVLQALQTTLLNGIANISGTQVTIISKEDAISATQVLQALQATLLVGISNLSASNVTIVSKEDSISATQALLSTEANATINKNSIMSSVATVSGDVNTVLTSAHGSGQWDAVNNMPVVLSADQPYYAPAKAGDIVTLSASTIADIQNGLMKLTDTVDGKTVDYILQAVMAMVNGDFLISGDTLTLYKRDGETPFSVMNKTTTERTRTS